MALTPGTRLGAYEVLALLGSGGMGEVYRARDTRLDRVVAIKVLPADVASDPDRRQRLDREARAISSLNHPHICTLYDVGHQDGIDYLVMELLEGQTLAERLIKGALPLDQAMQYAIQLADALDVAHRRGIVHRDLKPANVFISRSGSSGTPIAKLLDFGIAKAIPLGPTAATAAATLTEQGTLLGTLQYMAPEQLEGRGADARSDLFAFGAVLYEMLTGRRAFPGENQASVIAAVLDSDPPRVSASQSLTPPALEHLVKTCLAKNPDERWQAAGDVKRQLEWIAASGQSAAANDAPRLGAAALRPRFGRLSWALVGAAALSTTALAFIHFGETRAETPVIRSTILPPQNATFDFRFGRGLPALSPNGRRIVFGGQTADGRAPLWVRSLNGLAAQALAGTEGATFPFWSPDSQFIAFFADGKLKRIEASGGPVVTLTDAPDGRGGSWSRDGVIIFAPSFIAGPLLSVSLAGGASTRVSDASGSFPWFLPDGRHFLYQEQQGSDSASLPIRVGSLDGSPSAVVGSGTNAIYAQGHMLFIRQNTLMAQPFDIERLVTTGQSVPVVERVESVLGSGRVGAFSASEGGLIVYQEASAGVGAVLTWFDRSGKAGTTVGDVARQDVFELSPDQKRVAAVIQDQEAEDIWIYDLARGLPTRVTFDASRDVSPVWSPDGRSIVFGSNRKGRFDLYRKTVDGVGAEELLYADDTDKHPTSWSADGKWLLYDSDGLASNTGRDVWALPISQQPGPALQPIPVLRTRFTEFNARFSPNGRWLLYHSNESQRVEVYVRPFPAPTEAGKRQVSAAGAIDARWRNDGREIFYVSLVSSPGQLMAAEVAVDKSAVEVGSVRRLFTLNESSNNAFAATKDGRFLMLIAAGRAFDKPLTLIQNWPAGLR